jgi:hypothetical protein
VEEKVDGSQFSFGMFDGELRMKSKNAPIVQGYIPKLFGLAGITVEGLTSVGLLQNGWTYRAEAICKPKHNILKYDRTPVGGLIIFDINCGHDDYLTYNDKHNEAVRLGLECVPFLHRGRIDMDLFTSFLGLESVLGGPKIEGVVIKPADYNLYGVDKKVLMGKFVSEAFKETHRNEWASANPTGKDIVTMISGGLRTEARWHKGVQALKDSDRLEGSPRDIGPLLKAISDDLDKEVVDEVKEALFRHFWKDIKRSTMRGIPEWYKNQLVKSVFDMEDLQL